MTFHKSVLVQEAIHYLNLKPKGVYVDATFGGGGHTKAILMAQPECRVIAFDWDLKAIEMNAAPLQQEFGDRLTIIWSNFSHIYKQLKKEGIEHVDGILADFGTSQYQLTQRAGFSFNADTPLDMRMSPSHQKITAQEVVNKASEEVLSSIFKQLGEEPKARAIARIIVQERAKKVIATTGDLVHIIEKIMPRTYQKTHPATKVFQALRIYVNHELENISAFLAGSMQVLKPGGRLVCISFHSLEDRIVKQYFKEQEIKQQATILTPKIIVGSEEELEENPSARSARLRCIEIKKNS